MNIGWVGSSKTKKNIINLLNNKFFQIAFFIFTLILLWKILAWTSIRRRPSVQLLPQNASEVKIRDCFFGSDILYVVKAKMSENDFLQYVDNLDFVPMPDRHKVNNHWFTSINEGFIFKTHVSWWNPSDDKENTFYDPQSRSSWGIMLKYENEHAYYLESTIGIWDDR